MKCNKIIVEAVLPKPIDKPSGENLFYGASNIQPPDFLIHFGRRIRTNLGPNGFTKITSYMADWPHTMFVFAEANKKILPLYKQDADKCISDFKYLVPLSTLLIR